MATKGSIAKRRDEAINILNETGQQIAALLGIDPPDLGIFFRDYSLLQAEQLYALAEFNQRVKEALTERATAEPSEPEPVAVKKTVTRAKSGGHK